MHRTYLASGVFFCGLLAVVSCPAVAQAAAASWTGGGGDGLWSNSSNWDGATAGNQVYVNVDGANITLNSTDSIYSLEQFAQSAGISTTLNIQSGASLTTSQWSRFGGAGNATVNQTGGIVSLHGGADLGDASTSTSTYNLSAGTLQFDMFCAAGRGIGNLNISGTGNATGDNLWMTHSALSTGNGTITQTGGTVSITTDLLFANHAGATGTYHLNGGTLTVGSMTAGNGAATFDFTGGALHAGSILFDLINAGGTLAPGSSGVGATSITGSYTQNATGKTQIEMSSSTLFDAITISNSASLSGVLQLSLLGGYAPALGQTFDVLTAPTITINSGFTLDDSLAALPSNEAWGYHVIGAPGGGQTLQLEVMSIPEPSSIAMLALGLLGLLAYAWRKRK